MKNWLSRLWNYFFQKEQIDETNNIISEHNNKTQLSKTQRKMAKFISEQYSDKPEYNSIQDVFAAYLCDRHSIKHSEAKECINNLERETILIKDNEI